jgi:protein-tyrosine sulfotransferase
VTARDVLRQTRIGLAAEAAPALRLDEPVIVLTCARSGSTLLRFVLDAHPSLACPPETGLTELVSRMGVVSMLLDPRGHRPGPSDLGAAAIRSWVTTMFGAYLVGVGKARWCDKSLGSAPSAGKFLDLFPRARFICLYRNCMDVIDSIHEACPWGLRAYGLDPFVAGHPGNSVAAAADYWVFQTRAIAEFERARPDKCLQVRYEDLVDGPQAEADRIFAFLGEEPVSGIESACFAVRRDHDGGADHKIWETSRVHSDSVGRGVRVPVSSIPAPVLSLINELHGRLGYAQVSNGWSADPAAGVLAAAPARAEPSASQESLADAPAASLLDELEGMLMPLLARRLPAVSATSAADAAPAGFSLAAGARSNGAALTRCWQVDLAGASVSRVDAAASRASEGGWRVLGDATTWTSVLTGQVSLATAFRHGHLRYSQPVSAGAAAGGQTGLPVLMLNDPRFPILAQLLAPAPPLAAAAASTER